MAVALLLTLVASAHAAAYGWSTTAHASTPRAHRLAGSMLSPLHPSSVRSRQGGPTMVLQEVTKQGWCRHVENADKLTIVFFYAPWCRNCKAVRPRLERIEREFRNEVTFFQANFKQEAALCYEERVFTFPTVHFYAPGVGRVSRAVLTAKDTDARVRKGLARFLGGPQAELLKAITAEALSPIVQYKDLVGALEALATLDASTDQQEWSELGAGLSPAKESARLRAMVEADEKRLAQLEELFRSLDVDADGRLALGELESAVSALQPMGAASGAVSGLLERLEQGGSASVGVDKKTFVALMIDKAVQDFAVGEKALLPTFEALDADGDGTITQAQLLAAVEHFCNLMPDADGCEIDQRPLRLAEAFDAFANEEQLLDYERFVEMVSGRKDSEECEVEDEALPSAASSYLEEELEMMGERECFGEATTEDGEDDPGCDAWFYGQDPLAGQRQEDPAKAESLRAAAEYVAQMKKKRQEAEAAQRAKKDTQGDPRKVTRLFG